MASAGVTFSYVNYLCGVKVTAIRSGHQAEITKFQTQILHLKRDLASIERGVGDDRSFFDITRLFITSTELGTLPSSFLPFRDGRFFVDAPFSDEWQHQETTEAGLVRERVGEELTNQPSLLLRPSMQSVLEAAAIDVWRHAEFSTFMLPDGENNIQISLFPHVFVQVITETQIEEILNAMAVNLDEEWERLDEIVGLAVKLADELKETIVDVDETGSLEFQSQTALDVEEQKRAEFVNALGDILIDDISGVFLMSLLGMGYGAAALSEDVKYNVLSAQKKANVLYLRTQMVFHGVREESTDKERVVLDQEFFVVGTGREVVLVKVEIPSRHGQHDAFQWVADWLLGLRIHLST